jgi:probable rRNA maturation factor
MHRVSVSDCQSALSIDVGRIRQVVQAALRHCGIEQAEVSVAVVDDAAIHELNRRHLQHDYPTDVLSFALSPAHDPLEAEIIVSSQTAAREAARFGWEPEAELLLYVTHGVLHACGHDDHTPRAKAAMRRAERAVLQKFDLSPQYGVHRGGPAATRTRSRRTTE